MSRFDINEVIPGETVFVIDKGYSMILPEFYLVDSITPSGKSIRVREIHGNVVEHDGYGQAGKKMPDMNRISNKVELVRINPKKNYVTLHKHLVRIWDGTPEVFDTYD